MGNSIDSPPAQGKFTLVATVPAKSKEAADTLVQLIKAVQKRALSSEEPGTHTYRVNRSDDNSLDIVVFEEYENAAALKHHGEGPEFQAFAARLGELANGLDIRYFREQ